MTTSRYHTREGYESFYWRLQGGHPSRLSWTDFQLLSEINKLLIKNDCVPFDIEELEMELS